MTAKVFSPNFTMASFPCHAASEAGKNGQRHYHKPLSEARQSFSFTLDAGREEIFECYIRDSGP